MLVNNQLEMLQKTITGGNREKWEKETQNNRGREKERREEKDRRGGKRKRIETKTMVKELPVA